MPIKPEYKHLYPTDWMEIRDEVLQRAGHRCEGSPGFYPACRVANGDRHPKTGSKVVLTIAHLDHDPTNNGTQGRRPNLRAMCQRCHLTYDAGHHARTAAETRCKTKVNDDQFEMFDSHDSSVLFEKKSKVAG